MAAEGFAAVPTWMIRDKRVPRNAILVYASLSSRAGYGTIFPSQATIAEESGLSERTVRTMLTELEDLGVVSRERRRVKGAKRATDAYTLHPNGLAANSAGSSDLPETEPASTGNEQHLTPLIEIENSEIDRTPTPLTNIDLDRLFDEAYSHWPKKAERKASSEKFKLKVRQHFAAAPYDLVTQIRRFGQAYAQTTEVKYVPALCYWLNRERWTDELPAPELSRAQQRTQNNLGVVEHFASQRKAVGA